MGEKILFVDDDGNLLESYRRQLRNKFPVVTAADGEQGLRIIGAEGPFAVIVSDFRMPGMDGVEFLAKAREEAPDSVRILLTGYADLRTAIEAVNRGNIFRLLTKPCGPEVLLTALTAGVTQYRLLISERERAERERTSLEEQLHHAQKMETIGRLAGGIAHDFNNFLTVINTTSQLALLELEDGDPWREKFESIEKAGERAANLTRQLLAFSRRQAVETRVIDLNSLLRDLEKMLLRVVGEDIQFRTALDGRLGRVKVDPGQVEQAIVNLVVNARDAMPSGGTLVLETANTELGAEGNQPPLGLKPGGYVTLCVKDTGMGMTPEIQEKIFEPFFTTKERGKGTGLGLSIVYGIAKQSGGGIEVQSKPGRGTTFKIYLPRVDGPLEGRKKEAAQKGLPRGTETVLVAEDDDEVRRLAGDILRKQGYRVLEASSGVEALGILEPDKEPIHLLLTDVVMPEVSGPELARRLAYFYPEMKVLYMSGYGDHGIFQNGLLDRGIFFLQKPFSVESLTAKVRQVLDLG